MIKYELAKKLKDAGFPQKEYGKFISAYPEGIDEPDGDKNDPYECYLPSLSELIEACGDNFILLGRADDGSEWKASGSLNIQVKALVNYQETSGSTPEEAVANLWIKLHEVK